MRLQGSYPALLTPFHYGQVDEEALRALVEKQVRGGSAGLVACGSTGEAATLSAAEYRRVVRAVIEQARGRVPVIAGVATNATERAVEAAKEAERLGADALLVLAPYYNKPTQEGLVAHFGAVAKATDLPVVAYNIPGRTAVNILPATLARIAKENRTVVAVKEASGSLDQVSEILTLCPKDFTVLSGDDSLTLPMIAVGAKGVISVVANLLPRETAALCAAALKGDFTKARRLHLELFPLIKTLFLETNPIPVKAAAAILGLCSDEVRLPLTRMSREPREKLRRALAPWR